MSSVRRTVALGASFALASSGLIGTALAGEHGNAGAKVARTHLTVHAPANTTGHFKATVNGKLRSHKAGVAGETVSLQHRDGKGNKWADAGQSATTDADGKVSFAFTQSDKKEQYRLVFAGDDSYRKSHSGTVTITRVKPAPSPEPTTSPEPTESPTATA
jgi:hypothetical protein